MIKSNNPHLAGGEKVGSTTFTRAPSFGVSIDSPLQRLRGVDELPRPWVLTPCTPLWLTY